MLCSDWEKWNCVRTFGLVDIIPISHKSPKSILRFYRLLIGCGKRLRSFEFRDWEQFFSRCSHLSIVVDHSLSSLECEEVRSRARISSCHRLVSEHIQRRRVLDSLFIVSMEKTSKVWVIKNVWCVVILFRGWQQLSSFNRKSSWIVINSSTSLSSWATRLLRIELMMLKKNILRGRSHDLSSFRWRLRNPVHCLPKYAGNSLHNFLSTFLL